MLKEGKELPNLQDVAELIGKVAKHYISEVWSQYYGSSERGRAEIFVFGYCRQSKQLRAFRITPILNPLFDVEVVELIGGPNAIYWLGPQSIKSAFRDEMGKYSHATSDNRPSLTELLESLIHSGRHKEIGGAVQTSIADPSGAWVLPTLNSSDQNISNATASFLNIELKDIEPVGGCSIGVFADAGHLKHRQGQ